MIYTGTSAKLPVIYYFLLYFLIASDFVDTTSKCVESPRAKDQVNNTIQSRNKSCGAIHSVNDTEREYKNETTYLYARGDDGFSYRAGSGQQAGRGKAKYLASLLRTENEFYGSNYFCDGVILSADTVLTAAHCFFESPFGLGTDILDVQDLLVMVGNINRLKKSKNGQLIKVKKLLPHPYYRSQLLGLKLYKYDVGIVRLDKKIKLVKNEIATIGLFNVTPEVGSNCSTVGFGRLYDSGPYADYAITKEVKLLPRKECRVWIEFNWGGGMICGKNPDVTDDDSTCHGHGAPLICNNTIAGFSSFSKIGCGYQGVDVFTDAATFYSWILDPCGTRNRTYNKTSLKK